MAKNEVISLLIAFVYSVFAISVTGFVSLLVNQMNKLSPGSVLDPTAMMNYIMTSYFGSVFPLNISFFVLLAFIAGAIFLAIIMNDRIALGLIGAAKILLIYLGVTIVFALIMEQIMIQGKSLTDTTTQLPMLTLATIVISVISLLVLLVIGFVMGKPKRRTIING